MEDWFIPHTTASLPPASSVLVLAPHPDDEIFGCGGCMALYARANARVQSFILTDGGGYLVDTNRQKMVETRRSESRQAAIRLGMAPPEFGPWADRQLSCATDLVTQLEAVIQSSGAQVVFAPSLWEVHPDHRATAWAAVSALQNQVKAGAVIPMLAFYEIGAPLRPTHLVDISAVQAIKQQAMACFESQLAQQRYDRHIAALNTFRTYTLPSAVLAAEALEIVLPDQLQAFVENYDKHPTHNLALITETALQRADTAFEQLQITHQQTVQTLNAHVENLNAQIQNLNTQRETLTATRDRLMISLDQRQSELTQTSIHLQQVLASHSWRLTRPLRWLTQQLRRLSN